MTIESTTPHEQRLAVHTRTGSTDGPVIELVGEMDLSTVAVLANAVASVASPEVRVMTLDLSGLSFLDSSGVGGLVTAHRDAAGRGTQLVVTGATGMVRRVLEITGVWDRLSAT